MWCTHSDGIDVAGVADEGLLAGPFPHVPQLGQGVASSGDEGVHVGGQSERHAVSNVVGEDNLLLASLQVPQTAGEEEEDLERSDMRLWMKEVLEHNAVWVPLSSSWNKYSNEQGIQFASAGCQTLWSKSSITIDRTATTTPTFFPVSSPVSRAPLKPTQTGRQSYLKACGVSNGRQRVSCEVKDAKCVCESVAERSVVSSALHADFKLTRWCHQRL